MAHVSVRIPDACLAAIDRLAVSERRSRSAAIVLLLDRGLADMGVEIEDESGTPGRAASSEPRTSAAAAVADAGPPSVPDAGVLPSERLPAPAVSGVELADPERPAPRAPAAPRASRTSARAAVCPMRNPRGTRCKTCGQVHPGP